MRLSALFLLLVALIILGPSSCRSHCRSDQKHPINPSLNPSYRPLSSIYCISLKRPYLSSRTPHLVAVIFAATTATSQTYLQLLSIPIDLVALRSFTQSQLPLLLLFIRLSQCLGLQNPSNLSHCDRPCHITVTLSAPLVFGVCFMCTAPYR